jgi:hypothetical protein
MTTNIEFVRIWKLSLDSTGFQDHQSIKDNYYGRCVLNTPFHKPYAGNLYLWGQLFNGWYLGGASCLVAGISGPVVQWR